VAAHRAPGAVRLLVGAYMSKPSSRLSAVRIAPSRPSGRATPCTRVVWIDLSVEGRLSLSGLRESGTFPMTRPPMVVALLAPYPSLAPNTHRRPSCRHRGHVAERLSAAETDTMVLSFGTHPLYGDGRPPPGGKPARN